MIYKKIFQNYGSSIFIHYDNFSILFQFKVSTLKTKQFKKDHINYYFKLTNE